jgi:MFS family permease
VLRVMSLALMMVVAAVASLNVALPEIARDTGATQTELQWIVDAYALLFAALLLPAGAIGDRYGRRGVLVGGLVLFGTASAAALAVSDPAGLIAVRAVLGVAAALVMPVTLSVITTVFPPEERGKAVGRDRRGRGDRRIALLGAAARVAALAVRVRAQRRACRDRPRGNSGRRARDA